MERRLLVIGMLACIAILSSAAGGEALMISAGDPHFGIASVTRDTATGLEWLDFTATLGRSMDEVTAGMGPGGEFAGYRYATAAEVTTLYADAGIFAAQTPDEKFYAVYDLLGYMGYVPYPYSQGDSRLVFAMTGTGPNQFNQYVFSYLWAKVIDSPYIYGYYNIGYMVDDWTVVPSTHSPVLASFLVRDDAPALTPEPSTLLLAGAGLAAGLFARRRTRV